MKHNTNVELLLVNLVKEFGVQNYVFSEFLFKELVTDLVNRKLLNPYDIPVDGHVNQYITYRVADGKSMAISSGKDSDIYVEITMWRMLCKARVMLIRELDFQAESIRSKISSQDDDHLLEDVNDLV